jgi:formylglycine-generating enzyme required for sulfatase activity
VPAFRIGRVPVTVADHEEHRRAIGAPPAPGPGDVPVLLPHAGALAFCAWLAERWGVPVGLPSEDQWERAARGDDDREYPWGDEFDPTRANLAEAGVGALTPVGSFPGGASPFGVLDLAGNADEWTSSPYAPYPGADADVPADEQWAVDPHVTRGGGYAQHRDLARCARRHALYPPHDTAGFRVVVPA